MNRQDANKWAYALKVAASPSWSIDDLVVMLEREFPEPAPLCHVCQSSLNGDMCPKCQPEAPDVSALRFEGKEVEIAEPKRRKAHGRAENDGSELILHGLPYKWGSLAESGEEYWILRIKEQPSLSVYGCDPEEVSLEGIKGPNGRPVVWVDFREPNVLFDELVVWVDAMDDSLRICWAKSWKSSGPDKRRIIVREVEERKPRWYLVEVVDRKDENHGTGMYTSEDICVRAPEPKCFTLRPLADVDDPKVRKALDKYLNEVVEWDSTSDWPDICAKLCKFYLEYPCKS